MKWRVIFESSGTAIEIPNVIDVKEESGSLQRVGFAEPKYGATVRVRVSGYSGPSSLPNGELHCINAEVRYLLRHAKLKNVRESNLGVQELIFEAESEDGVNSPLLSGPGEC
ncbi:hypothetical protein Pan181_51020 [Aeoliella mucimassa]|uniref:Uncharacterized protein n=1 Tax=Aeoliella mucimassa TaxID=2527972 RepID=A0A518AVX1_9BACT|nr:hypothetical protein Pan181_51020 [Aeoliella mucimassa]